MINKKQVLLTRIDLLGISLEALIYDYKTSKTLKKFISVNQCFKIQENNKIYNFIELLKYIKQLKIITNKYSLNKIAIKLLKEYKEDQTPSATNQYNNRFCSIYTQHDKKHYYKNKKLLSHSYQINIKEISILNLYIITKLTKAEGIFVLIKYLYK
uniref:Uncharacterized protein n=1 Tax=Polysiphonia scopulorum TaxID=257860 RepID=A0A1Z1MHZ1_9FLOR|nr:hypothetical protein [Polysiphonia scopulorum]ARW65688.1 hypothetical protein [Polysiphonia scopulorum]